MDMPKLLEDLSATVQEMLMKLDAPAMTLSLNYPLPTLERLLGAALSQEDMLDALEKGFTGVQDRYGLITARDAGEGLLCLTVPAKGAAYMLAHGAGADFLRDLLGAVKGHASMQDVMAVFEKHGRAHAEKMDNPEFDYLVYFEDGQPDSFRYCLSQHGGHVSYHRFAKEDYESFGF